ncbi:MAG: DUF3667 domain-containing protein [Enterobacterales bacterium]|nr:DUF3667 domain-containing protein [Enterobacterales bacterium]
MNQTATSDDISVNEGPSTTPEKQTSKQIACSNCGTALSGLFCHECGQSSKSMIKFFGEVIKELLDDTLGYDSRLKHSIIPLIFKPAKLSLEYIKGRRFHYVLPFRLYLITSLLLIITIKSINPDPVIQFDNSVTISDEVAKTATNIDSDIAKIGNNSETDPAIIQANQEMVEDIPKSKKDINYSLKDTKQAKDPVFIETANNNLVEAKHIRKKDSASNEEDIDQSVSLEWDDETQKFIGLDKLDDGIFKTFLTVIEPKINQWKKNPKPLNESVIESLPYMMFILLPLFGIILKLFYMSSKRYYTEHLIFLLHNHSFAYLLLITRLVSLKLEEVLIASDTWLLQQGSLFFSLIKSLTLIWIFLYIFIAVKRFYQQSWKITIIKSMAMGFIYFILLIFGFVFALVVGAYQA